METADANAMATTHALPPSIRPTPPHITPQPRLTAHRGRLWPDETIRASVGPGLGELDVADDDVTHEVVDQREVLVVDVALLDVPDLDHQGLLRVGLVAHRERR